MGIVKSIVIRPEKKAEPRHLTVAHIHKTGIEGDHYIRPESRRQVTLIAAADLAEVAATVGFQGDAHSACRRNICVDAFPVDDMKGKRIALGDDVILEITGYCTPCQRMDENFGPGAILALQKKAGWTAIVIAEGDVRVGDEFHVL